MKPGAKLERFQVITQIEPPATVENVTTHAYYKVFRL